MYLVELKLLRKDENLAKQAEALNMVNALQSMNT